VKGRDGVEQEVREWRGEDKQLRKYQWVTPEPHKSLKRTVEELSPVSSLFRGESSVISSFGTDEFLGEGDRLRIERGNGCYTLDRGVWEERGLGWERVNHQKGLERMRQD